MILELITFVMLILVLALKYGAVTRIVRLKQRLREVDGACRKEKDNMRVYQAERFAAEREQALLVRQRRVLQDELTRLNTELELLRDESRGAIEELLSRNARVDLNMITGGDMAPDVVE